MGEVTSAAVLVYLAGKIRTAELNSKFIIHPITMPLSGEYSLVKLKEMDNGLSMDVKHYADIVNQETDLLKGRYNVVDTLFGLGSIVLDRDLAHKCGIVTEL